MKKLIYLIALVFIVVFNYSCDKNNTKACPEGEVPMPFSGNCIKGEGIAFYLGKPEFYCFEDSMAVLVNYNDSTLTFLFNGKHGETGATGGYVKFEHFFNNGSIFTCSVEDEVYKESKTFIYIKNAEKLYDKPEKLDLKLYQAGWNEPYPRFDSLEIELYLRQ